MSVMNGGIAADTNIEPDPFLTEKQASQFLGLSCAWFQRKRLEGDGPPFVKLGNSVRYRKSRIVQWMTEREQVSTSSYKTHQRPPKRQATA